jgi:hypothetical protein
MATRASRQPLTAEAWVGDQASPLEGYTKWQWDRFLSEYARFSPSVSLDQYSVLNCTRAFTLPPRCR